MLGYKWPLVPFPLNDFHLLYIPPALGEHVCPLKELFPILISRQGSCLPPSAGATHHRAQRSESFPIHISSFLSAGLYLEMQIPGIIFLKASSVPLSPSSPTPPAPDPVLHRYKLSSKFSKPKKNQIHTGALYTLVFPTICLSHPSLRSPENLPGGKEQLILSRGT